MTLFIIITVLSIFIDIYFHKSIKNKHDAIFYAACILITAGIAIFYYNDPFRIGIAEYVLTMLNIGG